MAASCVALIQITDDLLEAGFGCSLISRSQKSALEGDLVDFPEAVAAFHATIAQVYASHRAVTRPAAGVECESTHCPLEHAKGAEGRAHHALAARMGQGAGVAEIVNEVDQVSVGEEIY